MKSKKLTMGDYTIDLKREGADTVVSMTGKQAREWVRSFRDTALDEMSMFFEGATEEGWSKEWSEEQVKDFFNLFIHVLIALELDKNQEGLINQPSSIPAFFRVEDAENTVTRTA